MNVCLKWLQTGLFVSATVTNACAAAPTAAATTQDKAHAAAASDPLLAAMQAEMDRERDLLVLPGMQKPYFIEYRLDDFSTYQAVANYGALTREDRNHQRIVRVTIRIGDYGSDSSSTRGDGTVQLAPEDNDPEALRYALWTSTDEAYKNALRAYAGKQAELKRFEKAPTETDFAKAAPSVVLEPTVKLDMNTDEWKKRIEDASAVFLTEPALKGSEANLQYSTANVLGFAVNRLLVNSEGTVLRHGYSGYSALISIGGQADDGMQLGRDNGTTAAAAKDLESAAAFHARAVADVKSYEELRSAPVVDAEDFHGPVLFSGDAASDVLNKLFVPNVESDRPDLGTTARTTGAYQSSLRARVLPDLMNVEDDPLEAMFAGKSLVGAY